MDGARHIWTAGNRHLDQRRRLSVVGLILACAAILLAWPVAVTGQEAPPSVLVVPLPSVGRRVCAPAATMAKFLAGRYGEAPVAMGLQRNGRLLQVYAAADGSWTLVNTDPNGQSCIVATGEHWESLPGVSYDDSSA